MAHISNSISENANIFNVQNKLIIPSGVVCANSSCSAPITAASLQTQLEIQIRAHIARFYQGWMVCDDVVCGKRTRMMRVYGRRCLSEGCRGLMSFEVRLFPALHFHYLTIISMTTPSCTTNFSTFLLSSTRRRSSARLRANLNMVRASSSHEMKNVSHNS